MERIILKLSGEALSNNNGILSHDKMAELAQEIKELYDSGYEIGIVNGAGNIWRGRDSVSNKMDRVTADYIGMLGTEINSLALADVLKEVAGIKTVVLSAIPMPVVTPTYTIDEASKYFKEGYICIFGGGTGKPYYSTDTCAALRASELGCKLILMAKNGTDGVYDSDPRKNPSAKRYDSLSYQTLIDNKLEVIDLAAAKICLDNNIESIVFDMNVKGNIKNVVLNKSLGTIIK